MQSISIAELLLVIYVIVRNRGITQNCRGFQLKEPFSVCQVVSKRPLCNSLKAANID